MHNQAPEYVVHLQIDPYGKYKLRGSSRYKTGEWYTSVTANGKLYPPYQEVEPGAHDYWIWFLKMDSRSTPRIVEGLRGALPLSDGTPGLSSVQLQKFGDDSEFVGAVIVDAILADLDRLQKEQPGDPAVNVTAHRCGPNGQDVPGLIIPIGAARYEEVTKLIN